jgi:hypothetical protein
MARTATAKAAKPEAPEISAPSQARARPNEEAVAGAAAAVWVDPHSLVRWPKNPRRNEHAVQAVADSIAANGWGAPIVARVANRMIIAGDTRWLAATTVLNLPLVPVRFIDVDQRTADRLALADNKLGELAEWDDAQLADLLQDMEPVDQLLAGWGPDDVGNLIAGLQDLVDDSADDDEPEPEKRKHRCPKCKHEW